MSRTGKTILAAAAVAALAMVLGALALRHREAPAPVTAEAEPSAPVSSAPPAPDPVPVRPPPSPVAPAPTPPRAKSPEPAGAPFDEAALMAKLRGLEGTDPPLTMRLAREGNERLPDSPDAPERAWMVVKSLANMQQFKEARAEAEVMVKRYPGTSWSLDVQRHLLSNPLDD